MNKATLPLLLVLILLGNGLRSVISSTIFVSEGSFASFLKISATKTSAIIELLLGAVLLSLLISPRLISRFSERGLATVMCLVAGGASLGLAVLFWVNPPVATREAFVIILFPLIGFALASMAPLAQIMTGWGGERHAKLLTGAWAVAMPAAFLVTPQLVRVIAPRFGLDLYFAGFAILPLLLIPALWLVRPVSAPRSEAQAAAPPPGPGLLPAILCLLAFEIATLLVTLTDITSPLAQGALVLFLVTLAFLLYSQRRQPEITAPKRDGGTLRIFAFLFLVNIATTGFYDTSYLVLHMCSNTLIADRATLGALAQVIAAVAATALMARYGAQHVLMFIGALIVTTGLMSYLLYFNHPFIEIYLGSKIVVGFGTGLLTTAAIFAVTKSAAKSPGLALFIAFIIIIGTEVGLEVFEIFMQLAKLAAIPAETSYTLVFWAQFVIAAIAMPITLLPRQDPAPQPI